MRFSLIALMIVNGAALAAAPVSDLSSSSTTSSQIEQLQRLIQARGASQVALQQQLNELQEEVSELRGITETHSHKLEQIVDRQRELYLEIERRLSSVQAIEPQVEETVNDTADSNEVSYGGTLGENEAYDQAVNLILKERRYDDAIPEFQSFIKTFPNSIYIANAHYWLGQLLFNKAKYDEAKVHFDKVIRSFPDSNKRSDALLKQGTVYQKLDNNSEAKKLFEQVISEYPDSNAAGLAKSRLTSLN
ncbi:tol-pal system protein YbgF [Psychrosphaera sp. B3R10]|uniref:tol-pal system protein YbgF n=1 Tax=unclassified Psychrosphaera TaxID=2641570 RepID=UPI001C083437|nr:MULTISPECIES: tol-pal system protein YbgF [unclassified Psychrosphaera]MBU2881655.1 tol-pal system protein YbgF [Psychrosphaera sp. I2R16]MBU2991090.1 tol-pal system protein YbgF [Psychrosphaera sp. B3R10]MDO6721443.1 tol-pal system protein YbgF [Psychrosphaera sp. 1_MG-2023]